MSNMLSKILVHHLYKNNWIELGPETMPICIYCFSYVLSQLFFFFYCILVGCISSHFSVALVYLFTLIPLRIFCGGAHASTKNICLILSYGISGIIIIYAPKILFYLSLQLLTLLYFFFLLPIIFIAPVETKNKRFTPGLFFQLRRKCYLSYSMISILYCILILLRKNILYGTITICVMICSVSVIIGHYQNLRGVS